MIGFNQDSIANNSESITNSIKNLHATIESNAGQIDVLNDTISMIANSINNQNDTITMNSDDIDSLNSAVLMNSGIVKELNTIIETNADQIDVLNGTIPIFLDSMNNQISMLEARINSTNEDNMDIQSDIVNELKVSTLLFYQIEP